MQAQHSGTTATSVWFPMLGFGRKETPGRRALAVRRTGPAECRDLRSATFRNPTLLTWPSEMASHVAGREDPRAP